MTLDETNLNSQLSSLTAISPVDGRYARHTLPLRQITSEFGLIYHRVLVEVRWFQFLSSLPELPELPPLDDAQSLLLENMVSGFKEEDAARVKAIEATTNHDVKAIEYFLKEKFAAS